MYARKLSHLILMALMLTACGGGGGSTDNTDPVTDNTDVVEVQVSGDIYNLAVSPKPAYLREAYATQLNSVSESQSIQIDTTIKNQGNVALANLTVEVLVEDDSENTLEHWTCFQKFEALDGSGTYGMSSWIEYSEPLPACDTSLGINPECYERAVALDCANPMYVVKYTPFIQGYTKAYFLFPELAVGEVKEGWMKFTSAGMGVRPDHTAAWIVWLEDGTEQARQEYLFDVVP